MQRFSDSVLFSNGKVKDSSTKFLPEELPEEEHVVCTGPRLAVVPSRPVASTAWKFEDAKDFFELVTHGTDIETLFPDDWDWDDSFKDFVRQKVAAVTAEKLKVQPPSLLC